MYLLLFTAEVVVAVGGTLLLLLLLAVLQQQFLDVVLGQVDLVRLQVNLVSQILRQIPEPQILDNVLPPFLCTQILYLNILSRKTF